MPNITLTPEALAAALKLAHEDPANRDLPLRLYIEGKGCDGFYYGVSFATPEEHDIAFTQSDLRLVIDQQSLEFMEGSVISWVDDERGRGFLVDNPNQRRYRGKFFKRKHWQERLSPSSASSQ